MKRVVSKALALAITITNLPGFAADPKRPKAAARPAPAAASVAAAPAAAARETGPIPVTVVQVAGGQAYVQPGAKLGVRRGSKVTINHNDYTVVDSTGSFAVLDARRAPLHEDDRGVATVVAENDDRAREISKPRPLATWQNAWNEATPPASGQTPKLVPLGKTNRDRRYDVRLAVSAGGLIPLDHGPYTASVEVNARVHAEPFSLPIAFDADASIQRWFGTGIDARDGAATRTLVWVRELLVGYEGGGFYAGVGRMRYAASTLGTLDGARTRVALGEGFSIGAFGGALPNPLDSEPSLVAQRFGVEGTYSRPDLALRPEAALVLHGSTFQGSIDERRLSGTFALYPGASRVGGYFEVSDFGSNNMWNTSAVALTAAGFDASVRAGPIEVRARLDVRQPDRSRWLASYLPLSWFCTTVPTTTGPEPCDGTVSTRAFGDLDVRAEAGPASITVGFTTTRVTETGGIPDTSGFYAMGRIVRIANVFRIDAGANYQSGTYIKMYGASAGPGVSLFGDTLDLSTYYRFTSLTYRSVDTSLSQHGIGGTLMLFPSAPVLFSAQGEVILGDDVRAIQLFGTAMWRPVF